jgi:hypothetical protein
MTTQSTQIASNPLAIDGRVTWTPEMDARLREAFDAGVSANALSTEFGKSPMAIRKRATRLGIRSAFQQQQIRHGINRYRAGCRCEVCRAANAAQMRRYLARKRESA